ncbi:MAG: hypothetical protein IT561_27290 [Alphaproteobacteria bacterium]|nr:hypothetical protein [Alphaproteobacteria bacterium]
MRAARIADHDLGQDAADTTPRGPARSGRPPLHAVRVGAYRGFGATTRLPLGPILADADTRALFHDLMREVVAVGRTLGVPTPANAAVHAVLELHRMGRTAAAAH